MSFSHIGRHVSVLVEQEIQVVPRNLYNSSTSLGISSGIHYTPNPEVSKNVMKIISSIFKH